MATVTTDRLETLERLQERTISSLNTLRMNGQLSYLVPRRRGDGSVDNFTPTMTKSAMGVIRAYARARDTILDTMDPAEAKRFTEFAGHKYWELFFHNADAAYKLVDPKDPDIAAFDRALQKSDAYKALPPEEQQLFRVAGLNLAITGFIAHTPTKFTREAALQRKARALEATHAQGMLRNPS